MKRNAIPAFPGSRILALASRFDTLVMTGASTIGPAPERLCRFIRQRTARPIANICKGAFDLADAALLEALLARPSFPHTDRSETTKGGHFAVWEELELFTAEICAAIKPQR